MEPQLIVFISALASGLLTFAGIVYNSKVSATKAEQDQLREDLKEMRVRGIQADEEIQREQRNIFTLLDYISTLRRIMIDKGLDVPPMPILEHNK